MTRKHIVDTYQPDGTHTRTETPWTAEEYAAYRAGLSLTFLQLLLGLVAEQWITEAEAEAWQLGTLPAVVLAVIDQLPPGDRFAARARARRLTQCARTDALVIAMASATGRNDDDLDAFFETYAQV